MSKLRVHNFSLSLDGYGAGPAQSTAEPLGVRGESLHEWMFGTETWHRVADLGPGGSRGLDNEFMGRGEVRIGATIMGRNMFGPIRGPWGETDWSGWWGEEPPYHHPVFVLTHHPRPDLVMAGGTTFHFVTDGIEAALERATAAADGRDVRLGGGAATIRQYLDAGLIDDLHVAIVPILLGSGERLFKNLPTLPDAYECVEFVASASALHVRLARRAAATG